MQSKSLLIAIAALAVTATGVHAHSGGKLLQRANLSDEQRSAIEVAAQLRAEGDVTAARDVLFEAGIDEVALAKLRTVARDSHIAIHRAVEAGDYEAFVVAIVGTPLADVVTSKEDFVLFKEAHDLKHAGEYKEATLLFDTLGIEPVHRDARKMHHHFHKLDMLSDTEQEALRVAKQQNDKETARAILRNAGAD